MKIALFAALTLATVSLLQAGLQDPPSMPIDKAAAIAKKVVEDMKLPPEYFVRFIVYHPKSSDESPERYVATFEPLLYPPRRAKYIYILMDGSTSIEMMEE